MSAGSSHSSKPRIMTFESANLALHVSSFNEKFDNQHTLVRALRHHPLFLALTRSASITIPLPAIAEANLSAEVERNGTSIKFNLGGTVQKFTENAFRRLFELPKPVGELPSITDDDLFNTFNEHMGHNPPATLFSQFRKSKLSPLYQALVQIVLKCLTGKVSGMDQLTRDFYVLIHGIVTNTIVDYGGILWEGLLVNELSVLICVMFCGRYLFGVSLCGSISVLWVLFLLYVCLLSLVLGTWVSVFSF